MRIRIVGRNLPGRSFDHHFNVHVAVQVEREPEGLVAGDADEAAWDLEVAAVRGSDGDLDFKGPAVQGKRGDRFLYLTWGDVRADGTFVMFRRAKLMLARVDPGLIDDVSRRGATLVATVDLTDGRGGPRCARVDPPALTWSASGV